MASNDFSFCANNSPELYATPKPCDGCPAGPPAAEYSFVAKQCTGLTDGYAFGKMVGENDNQQFVLTPTAASSPSIVPNYNYHPLVPANKLQRKLKQQESTAGIVGSSVPVAQLFEVGKRDQWVDGQYYRRPPALPSLTRRYLCNTRGIDGCATSLS